MLLLNIDIKWFFQNQFFYLITLTGLFLWVYNFTVLKYQSNDSIDYQINVQSQDYQPSLQVNDNIFIIDDEKSFSTLSFNEMK